jgi:hypothetical protein
MPDNDKTRPVGEKRVYELPVELLTHYLEYVAHTSASVD